MSDLKQHIDRATRAFTSRFGETPAVIGWAPGRINLIGEHTDYTGGLAMPAAIDRRVVAAIAPRDDDEVRVFSVAVNEEIELETTAPVSEAHGWAKYVAGLAAIHRDLFQHFTGFTALLDSDLPMGAGLSSSAALELALANGLRTMLGTGMSDLDLARLCRRVENEYLGLPSGLLDQLASQLSREDHLLVLDFRNLSHRYVRTRLDGWALVVLDSGVRRDLAAGAYEERVAECREGLELLRLERGVSHARELRLRDLEDHFGKSWVSRLRHVVEENERVSVMESLLGAAKYAEAASLLSLSHASLRDLYEVSTPAMDALQEAAVAWDGCEGARMIGGGFGGCCIAMVREESLAGFADATLARYRARTGMEGRAWRVHPAAGAGVAIPTDCHFSGA